MPTPYYTDSLGVKRPFPVPVHNHDLAYAAAGHGHSAPLAPYGIARMSTTTTITRGTGDQRIDWESATVGNGMSWTDDGLVLPAAGLYLASGVARLPWWSNVTLSGNGYYNFSIDNCDAVWGETLGGGSHSKSFKTGAQLFVGAASETIGVTVNPMYTNGHQTQFYDIQLHVVMVGTS